MGKPFAAMFQASLKRRNEVAIMYFGRTSEFLLATAERMAIPEEVCTLEQLLQRLRLRGGRWVDELDRSHVLCSVNGKAAALTDRIDAGSEIALSSRKSVFEA